MASLYAPIRAVVPKPAKFGLVDSETLVTDRSQRWESGIAVDSYLCNVDVNNLDVCNSDHQSNVYAGGDADTENNYRPFFIETTYQCGTFGFSQQEYFDKAVTAINLVSSKAAEHEFWTGELAQQDDTEDSLGNVGSPNRYLASIGARAIAPTGTPLSPVQALNLMEQELGDCAMGTQGTIHMTRGTASALAKRLTQKNDLLYTELGTKVIAGTGYTGSGPNGSLPGQNLAWMYATGPVSVYLGDVTTTPDRMDQAVDISRNAVAVRAKREAAAVWDGCCHLAVLVDISLED